MSVFIICEYNPFHKGHMYQISEAKRQFPGQPVVCVMSGNFTQRGLPAVIEKQKRAECALFYGADLVLLLPAPWSFSSAERFARGGVAVASAFAEKGDILLFGSECADTYKLKAVSESLYEPDFIRAVMGLIKAEKLPFAQARERVYREKYNGYFDLKAPNDILALEYIAQIKKQSSQLIPISMKRAEYPSSTEIRKSADPCAYLPEFSADICKAESALSYFPADMSHAERILLSHLRSDERKIVADGENGVYGRIKKAARSASTYSELIKNCSSGAFTDARVRRVILYSYLKTKPETLDGSPGFTRLLAADKTGLALLNRARIPVVTKPADYKKLPAAAAKGFEVELAADALYAFMTPKVRDSAYTITQTPRIITDTGP